MWRADSLEKTRILRKIEARRRRGRQRKSWLDSITNSMDMSLSKLQEVFGESNGNALQYSCLENPMDGGAWWASVHGVAKSWTRLSDFNFTFHFHALEKELATHSCVLAWRIPGTGEPGVLPSMGSHRVRHDLEIGQRQQHPASHMPPSFLQLAFPFFSFNIQLPFF